jgi:site-specific DNA recombinase
MARVLGRIRLSKLTDESTSEERQRNKITQWAQLHDHEIAGWAVDLDVSGSVAPFETREFGSWLRDRSQDWDIVVAWKLDRLGRGLYDVLDLFRWCEENGKSLACVDDPVDLSTEIGKVVATILAAVANMELNTIKLRNKQSADELLRTGRWGGGSMEWGYRPIELDGGGYGYAVDEAVAPIIREVFAKVAARHSVNSVANWLTDSGRSSATARS